MLVQPDHSRLAAVLTRPRLFKYLVPILAGDCQLAQISTAEIRARLLYDTRDGPFSSTVVPATWAASAATVLKAASAKHAADR
jgi:hypothetical protein